MSAEDLALEEARLIKEAAELAGELGLSVESIGEGWSRETDIEIDKIRDVLKREKNPNYAEML